MTASFSKGIEVKQAEKSTRVKGNIFIYSVDCLTILGTIVPIAISFINLPPPCYLLLFCFVHSSCCHLRFSIIFFTWSLWLTCIFLDCLQLKLGILFAYHQHSSSFTYAVSARIHCWPPMALLMHLHQLSLGFKSLLPSGQIGRKCYTPIRP